MKRIALLIAAIIAFAGCAKIEDDYPAVRDLAKRIIPDHHEEFVFKALQDSTECFEIQSDGRQIVISASTPSAAAVGLNYYLKNYCLATVSWDYGTPVEMPKKLPRVEEKIRVEAAVDNRFFLNYCTFGYTMPWWGWNEWEHFIDWMALNGVTMPLAITGQEAVWQKVWEKHGMSDEQIRAFFVGPAHLPWQRMTNLDSWNGPLPQGWIDAQAELQKKILERERSFGMTPILPAFAGHVPGEIRDIHPDAEITRVSEWGGFADQYRCWFLAPMDPLYSEIQKDFLEIQTEMFGTDHIYGVDPFNEIDSPSWDPKTLAAMSAHIYESLTAVDPEATWLQMGWLFYADPIHWTQENIEAFLRAVPQDKLIMLDYYCEFTQIWTETKKFYDQPYIWCYLGNFGGNTMLSGNFDVVRERISTSLAEGGDNLWGIGSTLEGFGVNMFMYEYILDRAWKSGISDEQWIENLADRHAGKADEKMRQAWADLCHKIYTEFSKTGHSALVCAHPTFEGNWHWTTKPSRYYDYADLWKIWNLMLSVDSDRDAYEYDVVNVGRELLGDIFLLERDKMTAAFKAKDREAFDSHCRTMLEIIDDMDRLVATREEFSLKKWVEDARSFGKNKEEQDYYETNARTLVSVWGDSYHLCDYASRSWSGLLSSYYKTRWAMFIKEAGESLRTGEPIDTPSFDQAIWEFECFWARPDWQINYRCGGNPLAIARELRDKYAYIFE